jgi:hypothetical protein
MLKEFILKNGIEMIHKLDGDGYTAMHWVRIRIKIYLKSFLKVLVFLL